MPFKELFNKLSISSILIGLMLSVLEVIDRMFFYGHIYLSSYEQGLYFIYSLSTITTLIFFFGMLLTIIVWVLENICLKLYDMYFKNNEELISFRIKFYTIGSFCFLAMSMIVFNFTFKSSRDGTSFFPALFKFFQNTNFYANLRAGLLEYPFFANLREFGREVLGIEIGVSIILVLGVLAFVIGILVLKFLYRKFQDKLSLENKNIQWILIGILVIGILQLYKIDSYSFRNLYHILHSILKFTYILMAFALVTLSVKWFSINLSEKIKYSIIVVFLLLIFTSLNFDTKIKASIFRHTEIVRFSVQLLQNLTDFDRDGYSSFFAGGDSDNFNKDIHPSKLEIPNNGIDENNLAGDLDISNLEKVSYDDNYNSFINDTTQFVRNEIKNVILIHIDGFRNDRLTEKEYRDLVPNLTDFISRSVYFTGAIAQGSKTGSSIHPMRAISYNRYRPFISKFKETTVNILNKFDNINIYDDEISNDLGWGYGQSDEVLGKLKKWLEMGQDNFVRMLMIEDTHYPHLDRGYGFPKTVVGDYDQNVKYVDKNIGIFLEYFMNSPYKDNTIFCLFADHGEELLDHGGLFHGVSLYDELIRVPIILYYPNNPRKVIDTKVKLIDVYPTVFELIGLPISSYNLRDGNSLLPLIEKSNFNKDSYIFSERFIFAADDNSYTEIAIIDTEKNFKLIYNYFYYTFELYDLTNDKLEKVNLINQKEYGKIISELSKQIDVFINFYRIN